MKTRIGLLMIGILSLASIQLSAQVLMQTNSSYETGYLNNGIFVYRSDDCNFEIIKIKEDQFQNIGIGKSCNGSPLHLSVTNDGKTTAYMDNGSLRFLQFKKDEPNTFSLNWMATNVNALLPDGQVRDRQSGGAISGDGTRVIIDGHIFSVDTLSQQDWYNDYTFELLDTIPAYSPDLPGDNMSGVEWARGNAEGNPHFHRAFHYTNDDATKYVLVYMYNLNNPEQEIQIEVVTSTYQAATDSWVTSMNKGQAPLFDVVDIIVTKDLKEIQFVNRNGRWIQPLGLLMDDFAANTVAGDGTDYDGALDFVINDFDEGDQNYEAGVYAEVISGNGKFLFRAVSDNKVEIYMLNETTNEFEYLKDEWASPNAEFDMHWRTNFVPGQLSTNHDGSVMVVGTTNRDNFRDGTRRQFDMTVKRIDLSGPELVSFQPSPMDSMLFEIHFNEMVSRPETDDYNNIQKKAPKAEDFTVLLDGQVADPSVIHIRNVSSMNTTCIGCYNPEMSWILSFRTPSGPVTGDVQIAIAEDNQIKDESGNRAVAGGATEALTFEGFDAGGFYFEVNEGADLQAIINSTGSGDTVLVMPGEYVLEGEGITIMNKSIVLSSTYNEMLDNQEAVMTTRIIAEGCGGIRAYEESSVVINGFTVVNEGNCTDGPAGIAINTSLPSVVSNNRVDGFSRGIEAANWTGGNGDEFAVVGAVYGNVVTRNRVGIVVYEGRFMIVGNVIYDNGISERDNNCCEIGGLRVMHSDPIVAYNYVLENHSPEDGAGISLFGSYGDFYNNLVWGNKARRGSSITMEEFGLPNFDHNIVEFYGQGRNKIVDAGPNIFTEDPLVQTSYEPFAEETGFLTEGRFGVFTKVDENSIIFGNGWEIDLNLELAMGMQRIPEPISSSPDIAPFEHTLGMVTNPMVSVELNFPVNEADNIGAAPAFGWNPIKYATAYELQIAANSDFEQPTTIMVDGTEIEALDEALAAIDGAYYWRVRGVNPTKKGEWSGVRSFTTGASVQPLGPTKLLEPIDEQTDVNALTAFAWEAVDEATGYQLQVATDNTFGTIVREITSETNSVTLSEALDENTEHFWRVKALNDNPARNSDWTTPFKFVTTSSVSNESLAGVPAEFDLYQNYPNPFNPSTQIRYALPEASVVRVEVYNSLGQQVSVLVDGFMNAGYHQVNFNASGLSSGVYLYKITTPNFSMTKKMLLMK